MDLIFFNLYFKEKLLGYNINTVDGFIFMGYQFSLFSDGPILEFQYLRIGDFLYEL